jgi:hypothetical protein
MLHYLLWIRLVSGAARNYIQLGSIYAESVYVEREDIIMDICASSFPPLPTSAVAICLNFLLLFPTCEFHFHFQPLSNPLIFMISVCCYDNKTRHISYECRMRGKLPSSNHSCHVWGFIDTLLCRLITFLQFCFLKITQRQLNNVVKN